MRAIFSAMESYYEAHGVVMQVLDDFVDSYVMLIVFMCVSCCVVFLVIVIMRFIAAVVIWTLLIVVHVALAAGEQKTFNFF